MIFKLSEKEQETIRSLKELSFETRYVASKGFVIIGDTNDIDIIQSAAERTGERLFNEGDKTFKRYFSLALRMDDIRYMIERTGGKPTMQLVDWHEYVEKELATFGVKNS